MQGDAPRFLLVMKLASDTVSSIIVRWWSMESCRRRRRSASDGPWYSVLDGGYLLSRLARTSGSLRLAIPEPLVARRALTRSPLR